MRIKKLFLFFFYSFKQPLNSASFLYKFLDLFDKSKIGLFYLLLPAIFFCYIFYNRVFLTKLPRDITEFNFTLLMIGIIIIVIQSIILIITITQIYTFNTEKKEYFIFTYVKKVKKKLKKFRRRNFHINDLIFFSNLKHALAITEQIETSYMSLLRHFQYNYPYVWYLYYKSALIFRKRFLLASVIYMHFFIFIFPKILVTLVFFFEVIYFKEINYFYKILWILIIPLIGKFIRITCKLCVLLQYNYISTTMYIKKMVVEEDAILNMEYYYDEQDDTTYKYTWNNDFLFQKSDKSILHIKFRHFLTFLKMSKFIEISYDFDLKNHYLKLINIFINILTISGWTYVILYMLKIIN